MDLKIQPVILCGGSGTRLWPLSTPQVPKQFISLGEKGTLLEETIRRLEVVMSQCRAEGAQTYAPLLIMHHSHSLPPELSTHEPNIVYESYANDTGVAVAKAAFEIKTRHGSSNVVMLVLPADHYIENVGAFSRDLTAGIKKVTAGNVVLFGIDPTYPATAYGYIIPDADGIRFKEKPDMATAASLLERKALWNSGIFAATVNEVMASLDRSTHHVMDWLKNPREGKAASFDVAVLQEHPHIHAQDCADWGWSDVGSFSSFMAIPEIQDTMGISSAIIDSNNVHVLNRSGGKVVIIGCSDLIVVRNGDNLLIMPSTIDYSAQLKDIATRIG
jgi:mannose-1-phosphate guanylyltransferase/mannose-1-phosphate guanylyltransferase/mannose-6-phosphate isomerase